MACVDLPAFPLQLLLERNPEWRGCPVAVVEQDRPQGKLLWVNERARSFRVLPGMRYAAALSLAGDLRAAEVPRQRVARGVELLCRRLRYFTPHVEPSEDEPGVFWLDASGLERLHESYTRWAALIRADLARASFAATVTVGFTRFGAYATARARRGVAVFKTPAEERAASGRVPLDRLGLEPRARNALDRLGVKTVGRFLDLPPEGIGRRFGPAAARLHRMASDDLSVPLQPRHPRDPLLERLQLDHAETSVARLTYAIEDLLPPLLERLADRGQALARLRVGFRFESHAGGDHIETICPAAPTLEAKQLLELVRLRLEAIRKLPDGVTELALIAHGVQASEQQLQLFDRPRRDLAAANRALARVRARLGDAAVLRARLREGHLPEGSFVWERLEQLEPSVTTETVKTGKIALVPVPPEEGPATPAPVRATPPPGSEDEDEVELKVAQLIRRIHDRPVPLPQRPRQEPDGWMLRGLRQGPVVRVQGPYVVSGGWWNRPVHREYHFAETQKGELLWVYYDRARRRWFLHGRIE
jgi:protein ImuB